MSKIWDALQKVEELRDLGGGAGAVVLPERIRLTPKQRVAIQALLRTATLEDAAEAAGVSEMTLRRWLGRPGFVAEYYYAGRRDIEEAMARLDAATQTAMDVLEQARDLLARIGARSGQPSADAEASRHAETPNER